mmetsp:Transcript_60767/g.166506  ORF Transcript_60767/g.166506 Transcript_60767/m.166506 type:complete len:219 (-) Transcript_60767:2327-2983(-)
MRAMPVKRKSLRMSSLSVECSIPMYECASWQRQISGSNLSSSSLAPRSSWKVGSTCTQKRSSHEWRASMIPKIIGWCGDGVWTDSDFRMALSPKLRPPALPRWTLSNWISSMLRRCVPSSGRGVSGASSSITSDERCIAPMLSSNSSVVPTWSGKKYAVHSPPSGSTDSSNPNLRRASQKARAESSTGLSVTHEPGLGTRRWSALVHGRHLSGRPRAM